MSFLPETSILPEFATRLVNRLTNFVGGVFGFDEKFSPDEDLSKVPGVDPRFIPRVPMSGSDVDAATLMKLSNAGMKRGKLVTAQSHPELQNAWATLCKRAGFDEPLQLIITDSKIINAVTLSSEEVAVTTGLLKILNLRELMGVLGHELGHARYEKLTTTTRVAAMVGGVAGGAYTAGEVVKGMHRRAVAGEMAMPGHLAQYGMFAVGGFVGEIFASQVGVKPTEMQADLEGCAISGDPEALCSALRKLEKSVKRGPIGSFIAYTMSGYPTMDERVNHIRNAEKSMPPAVLPAPLVVDVQPPPAPPMAMGSQQPNAKISSVAAAERVFFTPENTLIH